MSAVDHPGRTSRPLRTARALDTSGPLPLWTVRKCRAVLDRLERLSLRIRVRLDGPCLGICHRESHLDIRQPSSIEPECVIQASGIEHLEDGLDVRGIEEPEVPGVIGQADHRAGPDLPSGVFHCATTLKRLWLKQTAGAWQSVPGLGKVVTVVSLE
jgi:hypothetical protein